VALAEVFKEEFCDDAGEGGVGEPDEFDAVPAGAKPGKGEGAGGERADDGDVGCVGGDEGCGEPDEGGDENSGGRTDGRPGREGVEELEVGSVTPEMTCSRISRI
jgi:hypothetical protein